MFLRGVERQQVIARTFSFFARTFPVFERPFPVFERPFPVFAPTRHPVRAFVHVRRFSEMRVNRHVRAIDTSSPRAGIRAEGAALVLRLRNATRNEVRELSVVLHAQA